MTKHLYLSALLVVSSLGFSSPTGVQEAYVNPTLKRFYSSQMRTFKGVYKDISATNSDTSSWEVSSIAVRVRGSYGFEVPLKIITADLKLTPSIELSFKKN